MEQLAPTVILDASSLLNLYATGRLREIALAIPYQLIVARYVVEKEAHYVLTRDPSTGEILKEPVDLQELLDEGLMRQVSVESPDEYALLVDLSRELDDGEARTGALAAIRGYAVATDDYKARTLLSSSSYGLRIISALELLRTWAEAQDIARSELKETLSAMQFGANYTPGRREPLLTWWQELMLD